ncbi:hypothetical protein PAV_6c04220 [Paenibacillus alvei DSM 29]|nr:hypothetical protein PAV_6c04220 [Paenibacillus alvei DSM 29]
MKTVAIVGTFDSKGKEFLFVKDILQGLGLNTLTIHSGVFDPMFVPDVSNEEVAQEVQADIHEIASQKIVPWQQRYWPKGWKS